MYQYCTDVCILLTSNFLDDFIAYFVGIGLTIISDMQFIVKKPFDIGCLLEQNVNGTV